MGFFDKGSLLGFGVAGAPGAILGSSSMLDPFGIGSKKRLEEQIAAQNAQRAGAKQVQYDLLGQKKGPVTSPEMEARIKALEEESKAQPLVTDPYFQGQRSKIVRGGAQELAGVAGKQQGYGVSGGFQNIGSISDIYDRIGGQLAGLGESQANLKSQKAQAVADMRQGIAEAQLVYDNAIVQAKMAIEAGDAAAAQDAMNRAFAAREQVENNKKQMIMGIANLGVAAVSGSPGNAKAGVEGVSGASQPANLSPGGTAYQGNQYANPNYLQETYNQPVGIVKGDNQAGYASSPWVSQRRGRNA